MAALYAKSTSRTLINFVIFKCLLCLTTTLTAATTTKSTTTKPRRFVTKLIHHDYALSPYYNHNSTITDRAISMMKRSMARLTYLEAKAHYFTDDDIRVGLVPRNTAEFMANISIREPQVPQLISIDSGNNVVWVQCLPCTKCFEQTSPIFYPSKSSTYTQFPCSSSNCTINDDKCDPSNNYKFSRRYAGGSIVDGLVGTEKFTFETSDEGISTVPDVVFGCASHTDPHYGKASGILDVASSLEVFFLPPEVVSLTDEDAHVGVPQVAELGDLSKKVTDKSIRPTQEFEGQNKSIKSRVRSTLMIWDTFAVDKVVDVSARVLLRLSPHASLYPSHLPYLFLRQMWYLLWKHKMLKMSTREQCQRYYREEKKLSISRYSAESALSDIADKFYPRKSGSRSSESGASSVFETSNPVGDLALEIQRTRSLAKLYVVPEELTLRVESGASSESGEWCLFDF
ncbi:hypothetical protein ACFX2C_044058 [Malus domestica]